MYHQNLAKVFFGRTPRGVRELKLCAKELRRNNTSRTPRGVRELKRKNALHDQGGSRGRTPRGVRELKPLAD